MQKFQWQSYLCDISLCLTICMMTEMHASCTFYYDISSQECLICFHPCQEEWMQNYLFTRNDCTGFMCYFLPSMKTCYWSNRLHMHFLLLILFWYWTPSFEASRIKPAIWSMSTFALLSSLLHYTGTKSAVVDKLGPWAQGLFRKEFTSS